MRTVLEGSRSAPAPGSRAAVQETGCDGATPGPRPRVARPAQDGHRREEYQSASCGCQPLHRWPVGRHLSTPIMCRRRGEPERLLPQAWYPRIGRCVAGPSRARAVDPGLARESSRPVPSQYAACAAFPHPVRRYRRGELTRRRLADAELVGRSRDRAGLGLPVWVLRQCPRTGLIPVTMNACRQLPLAPPHSLCAAGSSKWPVTVAQRPIGKPSRR